jgi:peptidoglycan-N-acetylglucosamine deacetylase
MALVRTPGVMKLLFPHVIWNMPITGRTLYLSFDDGPTPGVTDQVLSILTAYQARATFFCIGRNVERDPDILGRILNSGHTPGNHTYSHLKGWYTPGRQYYDDIQLASRFVPANLYRPPYGMITPGQVKYLKQQFSIVMWDIMPYDFDAGITPQQCLSRVIRNARPGSVVVFHDSLKASRNMLYALPRVLEHFSSLGYTFEGISVQKA